MIEDCLLLSMKKLEEAVFSIKKTEDPRIRWCTARHIQRIAERGNFSLLLEDCEQNRFAETIRAAWDFSSRQFSLRAGRSTEDAIKQVMDAILQAEAQICSA